MADIDDHLTAIALHEAAQAVVLYRSASYVGGITTIIPVPERETLGHVRAIWSDSFNREHAEARLLSGYAGGHAQRRFNPAVGQSSGADEEDTAALLKEWGWTEREQEFRNRSLALVEQHWTEIKAVARELLERHVLDDTEVKFIADIAAGSSEVTPEVLARYRRERPPLPGARSPSSEPE
jgi:hypothetical protein